MQIEDITQAPAAGFVYVQCIWHESRGPKDDCRAGTGIVWAGNGDVQQFPAALWPKLAPFHDVWRLLDGEGAAIALEEAAARARATQLARAIAGAGATQVTLSAAATAAVAPQGGTLEPTDQSAAQATEAKAVGQANATEVVTVSGTALTAEQLAAMPDDDVRALAETRGYALHPRLSPTNLRLRFEEAQAQQAEQAPDGSATD